MFHPWQTYLKNKRSVLVGDVVGGALLADREIELIPLFLSVAIGVSLERGFIRELHRDHVRLLHLGLTDVLDLERLGPNAEDAIVLLRQFLRTVQCGLNLLRLGIRLKSNSDEMNDGFWRLGQSAGDEQAKCKGHGQEFFHSGVWEYLCTALIEKVYFESIPFGRIIDLREYGCQ